MKILIIGGTGNVSSEITPLLVAAGHNVTVVNTGKRPVPGGCAPHSPNTLPETANP